MVGKRMMIYVSERLVQIKQNRTEFGGLSVLCVGDLFQLPPVSDSALYRSDPGELYPPLWDNFKLWMLTQIMRQKDDVPFANVLGNLRTIQERGQLDLKAKEMLLTRCFESAEVPENILHVYPHNRNVDNFLFQCI